MSQDVTTTIGVDLGDKSSTVCVLDAEGEIVEESRIPTRQKAFHAYFALRSPVRVVLEVSTHSPWVSRLLATLGHEVLVANPRRVQLIAASTTKSDEVDAELLARLGRADPKLLAPVVHRPAAVQADRALVQSRDALVRSRTLLVNTARGLCKSLGARLPRCSAESLHTHLAEVPEALRPALAPLLAALGALTAQIRALDEQLTHLAREKYPATAVLQQIPGVGVLIALSFVLTIQDPGRFARSREVGPYLGLVPRRRQSGASDPPGRITKTGDPLVRRLLVQGAQLVLREHAPDSALKQWGLRLVDRGGAGAKKRAVIAVARKMAVLMHRLWVTGGPYEPWAAGAAPRAEAA